MRARNLCNHKRERKKAEGLQSIQFRRHTEAAAALSAISAPGLSEPVVCATLCPVDLTLGCLKWAAVGFVVAFALMKLFEASQIHDDIPKPAFKIRQTKRATLVLSTFAAMLSALVWLLVQKLD